MIIRPKIKQFLEQALQEDIGTGDITTASVISKTKKGRFIIIAKSPCVVCGMGLTEACFEIAHKDTKFRPMATDGTKVLKGKVVAHIEGYYYSVLTAERTALNLLNWLSGIATLTDRFVEAVKDYNVQIMDTRKTIPTLRYMQKYAVRTGGGINHRLGLYDQILIKDNHLVAVNNEQPLSERENSVIIEALLRAKRKPSKDLKIEIEVKNLEEFKEALVMSPDIIMLDNMKIQDIREAVSVRNAHRIKQQDLGFKTQIEASGNINLENVASFAETGVDRISIGALTHSAPAADFSLEAE